MRLATPSLKDLLAKETTVALLSLSRVVASYDLLKYTGFKRVKFEYNSCEFFRVTMYYGPG